MRLRAEKVPEWKIQFKEIKMIQEKIRIFEGPSSNDYMKLEYPETLTEPHEIRQYQGFIKSRPFSPFYHSEPSYLPLVEIILYNKIDQCSCIVELCDHHGSIFEFYCENEEKKLKLISQFVEIMKNVSIYEMNINTLHKQDEEQMNEVY